MTAPTQLQLHIDSGTYADQTEALERLIAEAALGPSDRDRIVANGADLVRAIRSETAPGMMEVFLAEYGLSTDEGVALARSARRPQLSASGGLASNSGTVGFGGPWATPNNASASLDAQLVLYDNGQSQAAIDAAKAMVAAQRAMLINAEQDVLLDAATAYLDVRSAIRVLELSQNSVRVLEQQVQAARDRFEVGAVTRTDVSLTEAALASAQGGRAGSEGALRINSEIYETIIGRAPVDLQPPPAPSGLPSSLAAAEALALRNHPMVDAARHALEAAQYDLVRAIAQGGVTVALNGSVGVTNSTNPAFDGLSASISIGGSVPLYQGGRNSSLVRQAEAIYQLRAAELSRTELLIKQAVAAAWTQLDIARAFIQASDLQVEAQQLAYEGVQEEANLGARTTLDVLDAEQDLLSAQTDLVSAQRDELVAAYSLLASVGAFTVDALGLGVERYDPAAYFEAVQHAPVNDSSYRQQLNGISDRWRK